MTGAVEPGAHAGPSAEPRATGAVEPGAHAGPSAEATASPGWLARLGLAIVQPRWALAIAADRRHAGRSGSDLIALIAVLLVATHLRGLATAVWLGTAVAPGFGLRAAMRVLTAALSVDLGLLLLGALAVFALAGARRNLGRAFDLACIALVPVVVIDLVVGVAVPVALRWPAFGLSYGWMGVLIALAIRPARSAARVPAPPAAAVRTARPVGGAIAMLAAVGAALQVAWIAGHLELVKPMTTGEAAPAIALPQIGAGGALGDRVTLDASRGRITVLDFWATWCKPCLAAMPRLDRLARSHPDVTVLAINLDDAAAARALFDQRGYAMALVADDGEVSERYGVTSIPHTVVIDRRGVVREVVRGSGPDLAAIVDAVRASE